MEETMEKGKFRQFIKIRGANEHNLKDISVDIPRNELVVLTGLSGSGKVIAWLSTPFMRRGSGVIWSPCLPLPGSSWDRWRSRMWRALRALSPAISIDQKSTNRNPRSTVGTVSEIYDYLRLLYARVGIPALSEVRQGDYRNRRLTRWWTQIMSSAGADENPAVAGAGGPRAQGRACEGAGPGQKERLCAGNRIDGNLYELTQRRSGWRRTSSTTLKSWWAG